MWTGNAYTAAVFLIALGACGGKKDEPRPETEDPEGPPTLATHDTGGGTRWTAQGELAPLENTITIDNVLGEPTKVSVRRGDQTLELAVDEYGAMLLVEREYPFADELTIEHAIGDVSYGVTVGLTDETVELRFNIGASARYTNRGELVEGIVGLRYDEAVIAKEQRSACRAVKLEHHVSFACVHPHEEAPERAPSTRASLLPAAMMPDSALVIIDLPTGKQRTVVADDVALGSFDKPVWLVLATGIHTIEVRDGDKTIDRIRKRLAKDRSHIFSPRATQRYQLETREYGSTMVFVDELPAPVPVPAVRFLAPEVDHVLEWFPVSVTMPPDAELTSIELTRISRAKKQGRAIKPKTKQARSVIAAIEKLGGANRLAPLLEAIDLEWADACDVIALQRLLVDLGGTAKLDAKRAEVCPESASAKASPPVPGDQ